MLPLVPRRRPTNFLVNKPRDESYRDVCWGVEDRVPAEGGLACKRWCIGVAEKSFLGEEEIVEGVAAGRGRLQDEGRLPGVNALRLADADGLI